jgi:hypothetical protein
MDIVVQLVIGVAMLYSTVIVLLIVYGAFESVFRKNKK